MHWKRPRKRTTKIGRQTIHESEEGFIVVEHKPRLRGLRPWVTALADWQTTLSTHRSKRAAFKACESARREQARRAARQSSPRKQASSSPVLSTNF